MGRQTRLTAELMNAIAADLQRGCYLKVAAQRNGVDPVTINAWLKRGAVDREQDAETVYSAAYEALEAARAEARFSAESRAFDTDPKWWLSRGYARQHWRTANELEALVQEVADLRERLAQLQARQGGPEV